jgi:predicted permease
MNPVRWLRNLHQFLLRRDQVEREIDEELDSYLSMAREKYRALGASDEEADRRARQELGGRAQIKEADRAARPGFGLDTLVRDVRHALRLSIRNGRTSAIIVVTLALGIGASTAIFSVLNAVLLRDLPYDRPESLFMLRSMGESGQPDGLMAPRYVMPLMDDHPSVEAGAYGWGLNNALIASDRTPYSVLAYRVTPAFFDVFTDAIALGRGFTPIEPNGSLVLSFATWRDYFDSDPEILGAAVELDNNPRTVVGVAREGFEFPSGAATWEPLRTGGDLDDSVNFEAYLRLRPGVAPESLASALPALSARLGTNAETGRPLTYALIPLRDEIVGDLGTTVVILTGATLLLLLIAAINVANLLLARARTRAREVGLRVALGAGRLRIIVQLLTESLVFAGVGGVLGVVLAVVGLRLMLGLGPGDLPRLDEITIDARVLLFSVGLLCATTLLIGLAPAIRLSLTQPRDLIGDGRASSHRSDAGLFGALVVAEVALAVVLTFGAGLLVRSYTNLTSVDPGFTADRTLAVKINATQVPIDYRTGRTPDGRVLYDGDGYEPVNRFYRELSDRIRRLPGVVDVANGVEIPLHPNRTQPVPEPFRVLGTTDDDNRVWIRPVSSNYFSFLGTRILEGRDLEPGDRRGAPGVALVNETFARRYFPDGQAVGQRIHLPLPDFQPGGGAGWYMFAERTYSEIEVVGVVADVRFVSLGEPPPPHVFMSSEQFTTKMRTLAAKTQLDDPSALVPAIRREIAEMAPTIPAEFAVYPQLVDASIARQRVGMALLTLFGALALALAAVGIYGVMAHSVTERTALGGSARQVVGMVMRRGVLLGLIGVVLGLGGAVALRRVVAGQLFGVSALDPGVLSAVAAVLLGVSVLASLIPALRAARIDPVAGLRHE